MKAPQNYTSRSTILYNNWRKEVLEKSGYLCAKCNSKEYVVPHHIIPWDENIEKRYDVDNGVALCRSCHSKGVLNGDYRHGNWTKGLKPCVMCGRLSNIYAYQRCCSPECGYQYRESRRIRKPYEQTYEATHTDHRVKSLKTCVICGKETLIADENSCCSRECGAKLVSRNTKGVINKGESNGMYKTGASTLVEKACVICGKVTMIANKRDCCSYTCSGKLRALRNKEKQLVNN